MKRFFLLALCITLFPCAAYGEVIHEITVGDEILINSTLILYSENPLDYWELSLSLPEGSKVLGLYDEIGAVEYSVERDNVRLKTNLKRARTRTVSAVYSVGEWKVIQGLNFVELGLFGFENKTTYVEINQDLPYIYIPNAEVEYLDEGARAKKQGPVSLRLVYGGKTQSEHFFTNSDLDLSKAEKLYPVIEGITGINPPVKFGVAVLSEKDYESEYMTWSAGTFNGLVLVKDTENENDITATLIHETTHGFNSFALDWDRTNTSWFDEGVACYVTSVVYRMLDEQQPELFGEEKKWREGNMIYTLGPKKTIEDLWRYYYSGRDYMYLWSPQSSYDREFGYAFSELFIREYLKDDGARLHEAYLKMLSLNITATEASEKRALLERILGAEFSPCDTLNITEMRECTKELNGMSFQIPKSNGIDLNYYVEEPKLPEPEGKYWVDYVRDFVSGISGILQGLFGWMEGVMVGTG